jgi:8-oxo-dGTP pyrophosphatase MutT (NUDIX family)
MRAREFVVEYKTEEYNGLRFVTDIKNGQLIVRALDDWGTNELGHVVFNIGDQDELDPQDLEVDDRYQGQGIAKTMYDYVKTLGYEIHRSWDQTPAGAGFWNKHRGKDERVWEDRGQGAAGIILYAEDTGRYGLQQRSDSINDPGQWAAWGGGREPGESLEQCATRELAEESGYTGPIKLHYLASNPKYTTFIGVVPHEFEPRANDEWKDYCWVEAGDWPAPMHPGVAAALENITVKENFADGKVKGKSRPGRVKRAGASCDGSVTSLRQRAKNASGEKARMYHWCANMKSGRKKTNEDSDMKTYRARVRLPDQHNTVVVDAQVTARNYDAALRMFKAQWGPDSLVSTVTEIK